MNYEELSKEELINLLKENEEFSGKFGITWDKERTVEEIVANCDKSIPVIYEKEDKVIEKNGVTNLLLEGDNFHSLSILNYTHKEKIDVIYIDPPYNTGHKDFIYNDSYVDEEDGYRHSKWLNFMSKRLKLARNLLKETGVIIISIDDNEVAQLKLLCDKILGSMNCLGVLPTVMNLKGNQDQFGFAGTHEYTLVYSKNRSMVNLGEFNVDEEEIEKDWQIDDKGYYKKGAVLRATGVDGLREKRPNMFYPVLIKDDVVSMILDDEYKKLFDKDTKTFNDDYLKKLVEKYENDGFYVLIPKQSESEYGRWRWGFDTMKLNINEIIINSTGGYSLYKKQRPILGDIPTRKPKSLLYKAEYSSGNGTAQIKSILGYKAFENPKPVELIKDLIRIGCPNKSAVVLDFFAGSGTTGQAVIELNIEDNGERQFILCTNNENNICEDVTYKRIYNIINGYTDDKGRRIEGIDASLKYYYCDFVENSNNRDQLYFDLTEKCIPMLCVKDNNFLVYKQNEEYVIFTNKSKDKYSCVYYSLFGQKEEEFIKEIESIDGQKSIYKFALGDDIDLSIFKNVSNYTIEPIPYKIVELYKRIVKLSREED